MGCFSFGTCGLPNLTGLGLGVPIGSADLSARQTFGRPKVRFNPVPPPPPPAFVIRKITPPPFPSIPPPTPKAYIQ